MATLAYYYLLADPQTTFLDYDGGYDTTGPWDRHWFPAMAHDIGQPAGDWSLFATGADPANARLTYHIYQRAFGNALVLYKPLSYGNGVNGTLSDATATTHDLGGVYYPLQVDGTLGAPLTSITLRNGEGAVLVKTLGVATSLMVTDLPSSTAAGASMPFTVRAADLSGHVVTGYTGTVHLTSSDALAWLPADYVFSAADAGQHTLTRQLILWQTGSQTLRATGVQALITGSNAVQIKKWGSLNGTNWILGF
jgi:hypothetical protein